MSKLPDNFSDILNSLPPSINKFELIIGKDPDGTWSLSYESEYGFLKSPRSIWDQAIFSNDSFVDLIKESHTWIMNNYKNKLIEK